MRNYSDLWNEVLDKLELEFENDTFNEIFNPCSFHEFKNGSLIIVAPTEYAKNRLNKLDFIN